MNQLLRQKALEFRAALEAHRADLESQLAEVQAMIEGLDKISPDAAQGDVSPPDGVTVSLAPRRDDGAALGKLPAGVTKRQAVRDIVSGFGGADFTVNDILTRYAEKYPQDVSDNLRHDISRMLRERYRNPKGDLELVKEAERPPESNVYRVRPRPVEQPEDTASAEQPQRVNTATSNGSSGTPPIKQMVFRTLSRFEDKEFTQGEVTEAIISRWPDADSKNLASGVANNLRDMSERGTLSRRREGDNRWDPYIYRVEHDREGRLLDP